MPSQAEDSQIRGADLRRVLADAGGEDEPVDPAQDRGERANLFGGTVHEVVDGEPGSGLASANQIAHVIADAGYPEQSRFLVEDGFHFFGRQSQALKQI